MRTTAKAALIAAPVAYFAAMMGSTALIHRDANKSITPVAARNMQVFMSAPIFEDTRKGAKLDYWAEQQRRISFRLLADGVMADWSVSNTFNEGGKASAQLLARHNIALLPELDKKAKPSLTVDNNAGCLNLIPAAESISSMQHARGLLREFAAQGRKPGTYSYVGEDKDISIVHVPLPVGKTAQDLCTQVRPVHHHHHG